MYFVNHSAIHPKLLSQLQMTCEEKLLSPQNTAKGAITYEDGYLADYHEKEWLSLKIICHYF